MNTAFPAFQDALYAVIAAAVTGTPVSLGYPAGGLQKSHVWVAGSGSVQLDDGVSGYGQRDETMTTEVRVKVDRLANEFTTARDAAFTLTQDIEAAIAADVTLGGAVDFARVTEVSTEEAIPDERTRSVGVVLTVTATKAVG